MSALDFLHGIDVIEVTDGARPIRTLKSSVIGLVGTAGKGPVNTPTLIINNRRDAVATFGAYTSNNFTIPRALSQIFDQGGASVVVVNVLDPAANISLSTVTETLKLVDNYAQTSKGFVNQLGVGNAVQAPYVCSTAGAVTLPSGATLVSIIDPVSGATLNANTLVLGQRVTVNYTATLALGTDYTLDVSTGAINRALSGSKLLPNSSITVTYNFVDPSRVTAALVIGGVGSDGTPKGIEALWAANSTVFVKPRILLAPDYTHQKPDVVTRNSVAVALQTMAERLRAVAIIDCPNATKEEAVAHRLDFDNDRLYFSYPFLKVPVPGGSGAIMAVPPSPFIAGIISATDNDPSAGFWCSPSNRTVNGPLGLAKPVDFDLSAVDTVANYLNSNFVTAFIRENGFLLWGNRVSSGQFISVRRTADLVEDSIAAAHRWAVDRNITKGYVSQIVAGVNAYLRILQAQGAILGGEAWADPSVNTPTSLASGQLFIDFKFTPPYPAEHITFRSHLVNDYLASIFD